MEPGLTNEQIIRIEALTAAITSLPFGEPFEDVQARVIAAQEHVIYDRANRFAEYITNGTARED